MSHENQERQKTAVASESASPESEGKSMSPPAFQLKASESNPVQLKRDGDGDGFIANIQAWLHNLFHPQDRIEEGESPAPVAETTPVAETAATESGEQEQEQVQEQVSAEAEPAEPTREEQVRDLLLAYYEGFSAITVNIPNPDPSAEVPTVQCQVRPPYMINTTTRRTNAETNRNANTPVKNIINSFPWGFRHGKASASQIQDFLQQCIDGGHTTNNTSAGLNQFLDTYGIGVDCSGFTSQGYNSLMGSLGDVEGGNFVVNDTGSGSFRDSNARFSEVTSPSDLKPGDAMFLENGAIDHVRMVQDVTVNENNVEFVTIESRSGQGPDRRHWRFGSTTEFTGLERSTDGGANYAASTETPEFARFDALYPEAPEAEGTEGAAPVTGQ